MHTAGFFGKDSGVFKIGPSSQCHFRWTEGRQTGCKKGEKIQLVGFGTFEVTERAAREGRNPQTNEPMSIPASKAPKFKAGKALKDAVNE